MWFACQSGGRLRKQLLYGELCEGKRTVGGQRKRFKGSLKVSLKNLNIDATSWETLAQDRPTWRSTITRGAHTAEEQSKRAVRKARAASDSTAGPIHVCPTYAKEFRARTGLISHLRTHRIHSTPTD
nr:hypothetical protein BaRGS_011072 [Batillaria attramentaria]